VLISSRRDMGFQLTPRHHVAYRLTGRLFDQIYTVSDAVRDYTIQQHWMPAEKVISIPNGVDMDRITVPRDRSRLRAAYGLGDASHVVIDVGTVKPIKGLDVLVRTAAIVCRQYPRAMFLVAGRIPPAPYFGELQTLIESLGLTPNFRFPGHCDNVVPLLQMSDVFCHLSRSDGLSNALLEAMACALPCVATRVGGNPEVVEESRSGFIVPSERPELAADRVLTLLRYPECARHMGERGREIVEQNFTAQVMVRRLVGLYDQLLEKHRD
jgi:glycosyltransferase involved in cell wall biosynthesis